MSLNGLKWIYRSLRYRYKLEPREIQLVLETLKPGDTVVDIGAHKGAFTYWMRKAVGLSGRVIAFEPQPDLATALQSLTRHQRFRNVSVECLGLSSSVGMMSLHVPERKTSPGATLESSNTAQDENSVSGGHSYTVPVTTLDAYFAAEEQPAVIRLIKCDSEGHELEVFRGAEQILRQMRPSLLFECEARHRASGTVVEVFDYLISLGYSGYFVDHNGLQAIEKFKPEWHQAKPGGTNYVNNFFFRPQTIPGDN